MATGTFSIKIEVNNDAFQDGSAVYEVGAILNALVEELEHQGLEGYNKYRNLYDVNGNVVGKAKYRRD